MARRLSEVVVVAMQRNDWKRTRSSQFEEETSWTKKKRKGNE
jgi:hypothetical protein